MTRAETVTLVNNVFERNTEPDGMLPDMITFPDCEEGKWYYNDIQERPTGMPMNWRMIATPPRNGLS